MKLIVRVIFPALFAIGVLTADAAAAPSDQNEIIVPNTATSKSVTPPSNGAGSLTAVAVILLAGAGGWLVWRNRSGGITGASRTPRQLVIEETRSLGNRQFVVVAAYQDKKFLLGVCPGRIDFLAPLTDGTPQPEKARS